MIIVRFIPISLLLAFLMVIGSGCQSTGRQPATRTEEPSPFKRARSLGLLESQPDYVAIPWLIKGLEDEDLFVRYASIEGLRKRTGETRGYRAWEPRENRMEAVSEWKAWWTLRDPDAALPSPNDTGLPSEWKW